MTDGESIRNRVARVLERIEQAARRSGRKREDVRLVAVGKTHPVESIGEAIEAGLTVFGENYVQEAEGKIRAFPQAEWHLVGKLQRNKVKRAVSLFSWIQTVDSLGLLAEISRRAGEGGKVLPVLAEVNLAGERSKTGVAPGELAELVDAAPGFPGVRLSGLMAIPPWSDDPEASRPYFIRLRELLAECASRIGAGSAMTELSMGMSNDFEAAIEEGATMVRVGTAIFGSRAR
ncbi:MAG TPA: YggS family pyridoxal phosphate-dependent enzyme [Candidatus Deferrimicrobiaceae bacterium]|nr:YggS family pyridoxal phosphate-dependent enzyme [Candidatus Deferrimicrobiaceae bacterium]